MQATAPDRPVCSITPASISTDPPVVGTEPRPALNPPSASNDATAAMTATSGSPASPGRASTSQPASTAASTDAVKRAESPGVSSVSRW